MAGGGDSTTVVANDPRARRFECSGEWYLVTIHGKGLGEKYTLRPGPTTIGRGPSNDVVIAEDGISRVHCCVEGRDGAFFVTDRGSTNGTYVNQQELTLGDEQALVPGDVINLGAVAFKVLDGTDVESQYHEELYRTAIVDRLTELHNRRYLEEFLEREMLRATRYERPLALLMADVDHFKQINDRFGHLAGDAVLRDVATTMRQQVRRETCCARYGGEEFAVVLPETHRDEAHIVAERIRQAVEHREFTSKGDPIPVTVSIGIASLEGSIQGIEAFFEAADRRLYAAKNGGRNRVE